MQKVDAVIVTFNRLAKLQHALDCYDKQTIPFRTLIVVDNHSTDGTIEFLKEWEKLQAKYAKHVIYLPSNAGGSGGFYEGEKSALTLNPDWVYVADDDAYPEKQMVEKFEEFYVEHKEEKVAAICTSVWDMTESIMYGCRCHAELSKHAFKIYPSAVEEYRKPYFEFNCLSYVGGFLSAKALKEKGLVNKDFFIYQDDTEHSMRLNTYGKMYCVPGIRVDHDSVPSSQMSGDQLAKILWKEYYAIRNRTYMLLKLDRRAGINAIYEHLSAIHSHKDKSISPVERMVIEGSKDAYLGRLGIHPIYRPGLDVRTTSRLPYPKLAWQIIYFILCINKQIKGK